MTTRRLFVQALAAAEMGAEMILISVLLFVAAAMVAVMKFLFDDLG